MTGIRFDAKEVENWLESAPSKADIAVKMFAQEGAKKFENYAKTNRPWTDRTSRARQGLKGWVENFATKVRIHIGHGVDYGIWLELAHEKRFAILQRTLNAVSLDILQGFKDLMRYLK